ncbi:hypothetical protein [Hyphobacterium sp.]|uniref:hypothetical protein n=1 Tax=Hyphobacterium sp. TaxID=2004662 RepID=UPI003B521690
MKPSLMLAAVSSLALAGAAAADMADTETPDKDAPVVATDAQGNPEPAVDTPAIDKPELGIETASATGDKPEADEQAALPERSDLPGKPPAGR